MERGGSLRIYGGTKGMMVREQVAYGKRQTAALNRRQRAAKK